MWGLIVFRAYQGVSNTPAWIVSRANQYARMAHKTPFCIYQGHWNVMSRDLERDIIPMARFEGMALAPWDVLAGGKIRSDAQEEERRKSGEKGMTVTSSSEYVPHSTILPIGRMLMDPNWERTEEQRKICKVLEEVAEEVGAKNIQAGTYAAT